MIIDQTNGKLKEVKEFAATHPKGNTLTEALCKLELMAHNRGENYAVWLFPDFAPYSLEFAIINSHLLTYTREDISLNGGLIFHGSHDGYGSGSAPSFSVCLDDADGWRIHT